MRDGDTANTGSGAGEKAGTLLSRKRMVDAAQDAILKETAGSDKQASGGALRTADDDVGFEKKEVRIAGSV